MIEALRDIDSRSDILRPRFDIHRDGNTLIVISIGEFDLLLPEEFTAAMARLAEAFTPNTTAVVVDLHNHSASAPDRLVGPLIVLWKRVRNQQGKLVVCGLGKYGLEIVKRSRLHLLWTICQSREEALAAVA